MAENWIVKKLELKIYPWGSARRTCIRTCEHVTVTKPQKESLLCTILCRRKRITRVLGTNCSRIIVSGFSSNFSPSTYSQFYQSAKSELDSSRNMKPTWWNWALQLQLKCYYLVSFRLAVSFSNFLTDYTRLKIRRGPFIWISRCEDVQRDPPDTPTWLVSPKFVLTQLAGGKGVLKSRFLSFFTLLG